MGQLPEQRGNFALLSALVIFPITYTYGMEPKKGAGLVFVTTRSECPSHASRTTSRRTTITESGYSPGISASASSRAARSASVTDGGSS